VGIDALRADAIIDFMRNVYELFIKIIGYLLACCFFVLCSEKTLYDKYPTTNK